MLAVLVRTHRTTVTGALKRLADQGLATRCDDGAWVLRGEPPERLTALRRALGG
jgi:hypothetical protein